MLGGHGCGGAREEGRALGWGCERKEHQEASTAARGGLVRRRVIETRADRRAEYRERPLLPIPDSGDRCVQLLGDYAQREIIEKPQQHHSSERCR